jgi:hypothetical protein
MYIWQRHPLYFRGVTRLFHELEREGARAAHFTPLAGAPGMSHDRWQQGDSHAQAVELPITVIEIVP